MKKLMPYDLQSSIDALNQGCGAEGFKVDALLERPLEEIVPFAQRWNIPLEDLRDICQLLIQRLDQMQVESGSFEELAPPSPAVHRLPPHSLN